ncbi:hypothetical protein D3C78_1884890 [compost metagenome]
MRGTEMQTGTNAHLFQAFHQLVAIDTATLGVNAHHKQVPGVVMRIIRQPQRQER